MSSPAIRRITQAGVVGALALGVSGVVVMDKSVALSVDGEKSTVHAFGGTVGDVLEKQGVELGPHDVVTPSAESPVDDGQTIVVRYGRKLTVTVDGKEREYWTTASTVGEALQQLGIRNGDGAILSASRSQTIGRKGLDLRVSTPKQVKLLVGGKRSTATVTATTVEDALTQAEVRYDGNDLIKPGAKSRVTDGMTIRLDRVNRTGDTRTEVIPYETVVKKDSSLYEGQTKLQQEGRAGSRTITYRVSKKNGEVVYSRQTMVKVTAEPVDRIVLQGTKARPAPKPAPKPKATSTPKPTPTATSTPKPSTPSPEPTSTPSKTASTSGLDLSRADMWDRIAQCESTGNWSINTGNGYYGGLQFDLQTWLGAGGGDFASRPDLASREQQITVANRVYADRGLQPWGCAHAA